MPNPLRQSVQLYGRKRIERRSRRFLNIFGLLALLGLMLLDLELLEQFDVLNGSREKLQIFLGLTIMGLLLHSSSLIAMKFFSASGASANSLKTNRHWLILNASLSLLAVVFFSLWLSRWLFEADPFLDLETRLRYHPFRQVGILLALLAFSMGFRSVYFWWKIFDLTPGRKLILVYAITSALGTLLLILPWSLNAHQNVNLIDAFFICVSALTVTGLSPINVANTFSTFGITVIMMLIQVGGLGIVVISVSLVSLAKQKLSLAHSMMGQHLYDLPNIGGLKIFIQRVIGLTFLIEFVGFIWLYFLLPDIPNRFFHALFHTISAFCNAGFSSFESNLDQEGLFGFKSVICLLIVAGGLGFPVLFELGDRMVSKTGYRRFSGNTVLTLGSTLVVFIVGVLGIFFSEWFATGNSNSGVVNHILESIFYSISARTAGFNITNLATSSYGAQLVLCCIMIIGGSPISTAGGIKNTTAAVLVISALSLLRGHKWIQFRQKEIPLQILQKSVTVILLYLTAMLTSLLLLALVEKADPLSLSFEVISALSTVGLSLGVTEQLGVYGKLILVVLMVMGRLGLVSIVYIGVGKITPQRFHYSKTDLFVG